MEELEEAIAKIKIGKICGEDNLEPEMIKGLDLEGKEWLLEMYRKAWQTRTISQDWENNGLT